LRSTPRDAADTPLAAQPSPEVRNPGGELARLVQAFDWSATSLGPLASWPQSLKTAVDIVLHSPVPLVLLWGSDGVMIYNDAYSAFAGARHPGLLGCKVLEGWPEVADFNATVMRVGLAGGTLSYREQHLVLHRNGPPEDVWMNLDYSPVLDESGRPAGVLAVVVETTESVRAEQALRAAEARQAEALAAMQESEERFRLIANSAPVPMWVTQLGGKRRFANTAYCDFLGEEYEQAIDFDWRRILHPEDMPRIFAEQRAKEASLKPFSLEARYRRADGSWRWLRSESQPRFDVNGEHAGFIGVAFDITEAKEAREALERLNETLETQVEQRTRELRLREAHFRGIFDSTHQLIGVVGLDGTLLDVNRAALDVIGAEAADVVGQRFWDTPWFALTPNAAEAVRSAIAEAGQGRFVRRETYIRLADGSERIYDFSMKPARDEVGQVLSLISEAHDITEQRAMEDALRQAHKMEAVGQLTGGIAHDFNNLLAGIVGSLELIQRRVREGRVDTVERFANAAMSSAQRAAALTHRLLAFARRQPLDPRAVDANRLIASMEDLLRRTLGPAIETELVMDAALWRTLCDPNQLESALLNLAINSRDAMPDGGRLVIQSANVELGASQAAALGGLVPRDYVTVAVSDSGTGMAPDVISRAFDPFFTTKPLGQGTGLGLSMVYGFAKQSDGHVSISSEEGRGTKVTLYLPRHDGRADESEETGGSDAAIPALHQERLLVVEDDTVVRELVVEVLRDLGYAPLQASDGKSGLRVLEAAGTIDLLVTDIGLPGLNGRQLADAARERRPDLKVLFITGYAESAAMAGGFLAPGMEMLTKPFAADALARKVTAMLKG
jgi:PAS domain S-box-containing protein